MIIKTSLKKGYLKRIVEHIIPLAFILVLIPFYFCFELFTVLPDKVPEYNVEYFIHLFCGLFILFNIIGNLLYGVFTNTTITGKMLKSTDQDWTFCSVCECYQPPRAWHCDLCDVCILKRDHHCSFFACCVGYYNHRYFLIFTMYVFIGTIYSLFYNVLYAAKYITWNHGLAVLRFIFPLLMIAVDLNFDNIYVYAVVINIFIAAFTGFLLFYHMSNVLRGQVVHETRQKEGVSYDKGWKLNIIEVLGSRWYLTWIAPFIKSPLPGNGLEWDVKNE